MLDENKTLDHIVRVISILANPSKEAAISPNPGSTNGFTILSGQTDDFPVSQTTTRGQATKQAFDIYMDNYDAQLDSNDAHLEVFKKLADNFTDPKDKIAIAEVIFSIDPEPNLVGENFRPQEIEDVRGADAFRHNYSASLTELGATMLADLSDDDLLLHPNAGRLLACAADKVRKNDQVGKDEEERIALGDKMVARWQASYDAREEPMEMIEDALEIYTIDDEFQSLLKDNWRRNINTLKGEEKRPHLQRALARDMGMFDEASEMMGKLNAAPAAAERSNMMRGFLENLAKQGGGAAPRPGDKPTNS